MPTIVEPTKTDKVDFGKGPFSAKMESAFERSQKLLRISPEIAEKFARTLGSDLGVYHKLLQFDLSFGKPNKDFLRAILLKAKSARISLPQSLQVMVAMNYMEDAQSYYISYGFTQWRLADYLQDWLDDLCKPKETAK